MNLYKETTTILKQKNKTWDDVEFVEFNDFNYFDDFDDFDEAKYQYIDKQTFIELSKKVYYDDGYGAAEVCETLKVVGENWWLERHQYDGSEWWEYKTKPVKPECNCSLSKQELFEILGGRGEVNKEDD